MHELCAELGLSGECLFKESTEQLRADGYHANVTAPQVMLSRTMDDGVVADVGQAFEYPCKPHQIMSKFKELIEKRSTPPLHAVTLALIDAVAAAEGAAKRADALFKSPIWEQKKSQLKDWGLYAYKSGSSSSKLAHGYRLLEDLYEATRLVAVSQQGGLELAMMYLEMVGVLGPSKGTEWAQSLQGMQGDWGPTVKQLHALQQLWDSCRADLNRAAHLKEVCYSSELACMQPSAFKCIQFSQCNVTSLAFPACQEHAAQVSKLRASWYHSAAQAAHCVLCQ